MRGDCAAFERRRRSSVLGDRRTIGGHHAPTHRSWAGHWLDFRGAEPGDGIRQPVRNGRAVGTTATSHIIGRPDDNLLDVMLGDGADPEQAFIAGSEQDPEEGDGFEARWLGHAPTVSER